MNKQKLTYVSPETETLVIRFEDSILQITSPGGGAPGFTEDTSGSWD